MVDAQRLLDRTEDGIHRIERTIGVLEDRLDMPTEVEQLGFTEIGDILALIEHLARSRLKQTQHHIRHGGLAGAGFAHNRQRGAALDGEGHVIDSFEHLLLTRELELLRQMFDRDDMFTLLQRLLTLDLVFEQGVRVLAVFLGGDDALGGE